jgi:hypothetical protein
VEWYYKNCLYLDDGAREAFPRAFLSALHHPDLLLPPHDDRAIKENWNRILELRDAITKGVELPSIRSAEAEWEGMKEIHGW